MLKNPSLFQNGFYITSFPLSEKIEEAVKNENWEALDESFKKLTGPTGELFNFLKTFHEFEFIEFIISIRDSNNPWEEDGIWHDDGSRVFAFSLSLSFYPETIEGGRLGIRKKGEVDFHELTTPPYGSIILFLTGSNGFEHKIHRVKKGKRIIIAGWCS